MLLLIVFILRKSFDPSQEQFGVIVVTTTPKFGFQQGPIIGVMDVPGA
jgi:hypothetical protein